MLHGIEPRLKRAATELGFSLVGIARAEESRHTAFYKRWLGRGAHGEMGYLARPDAVARRGDPKLTLPSVRSVVVVADEYFGEDEPSLASDRSLGVVARYARGRDYHKVLERKLEQLLDVLRREAGVAVE